MITAITGQQGGGKTTLLMAMVRHIYSTLTIRAQEMAFELHLRKLYPERNILTFCETDSISGQEGLDIQKNRWQRQYFGGGGTDRLLRGLYRCPRWPRCLLCLLITPRHPGIWSIH